MLTVLARATELVAGLALLALVGCAAVLSGFSERHDGDRVVHQEGAGILSASAGRGGKGLSRPTGLGRNHPWHGSFGGLMLCLNDAESERVRVDRVRYEFVVPPRVGRTWVRTVPEPAEQQPGIPSEWSPFYGLVGYPGAFRSATIRGDFTPFARGLAISGRCKGSALAFIELVTVLEAGPDGAWSSGVLIDYTADGDEYTLRVPWEMVACGTRTAEFCRG